jgi:hypothetical protein
LKGVEVDSNGEIDYKKFIEDVLRQWECGTANLDIYYYITESYRDKNEKSAIMQWKLASGFSFFILVIQRAKSFFIMHSNK